MHPGRPLHSRRPPGRKAHKYGRSSPIHRFRIAFAPAFPSFLAHQPAHGRAQHAHIVTQPARLRSSGVSGGQSEGHTRVRTRLQGRQPGWSAPLSMQPMHQNTIRNHAPSSPRAKHPKSTTPVTIWQPGPATRAAPSHLTMPPRSTNHQAPGRALRNALLPSPATQDSPCVRACVPP